MKRFVIWSLVISLIISLAAPYGAAFALEQQAGLEPVELAKEPLADIAEVVAEEGTVPAEVIEETSVELPDTPGDDSAAVVSDDQMDGDIADPVVDPPTVPVRTSDKRLVISYIQTSAIYGKYIEITNISSTDYHTKGLVLQHIRATDKTANSPDILASFYGTIRAGSKVVIGDDLIKASQDQSADMYFVPTANTVMSPNGGWLVLSDGVSELDSFCWAKDSSGLCGEDYYPNILFSQEAAYGRCMSDTGAAIECQPGIWFEQVSQRAAAAGGGFVPFYNSCSGVKINELAPRLLDQFIELVNETDEAVSLERCLLQINTRVFQFGVDDAIAGGGYLVVKPEVIGVSLARTTAGQVRLLSSGGELVDALKYGEPKEDRSAILDEDDGVVWTLTPTPGLANEYVQYAPCEVGYWRNEETGKCNKNVEVSAPVDCGEGRERNPETGRCRNIVIASTLVPCRDGQYRSEETNRCRSIATTAASVLKPCADNQFRNPLTNRCKNIASSEDLALADCGEGRERNPETNRCRNIVSAAMPSVPFAPEKIVETTQSMAGWWAFAGVSVVALGYAGWQWRFEAGRLISRIGQAFVSGGKQ